jgi:CHAD domain-containing protein
VAEEPKFQLAKDEPVGAGLERALNDQLEAAAGFLRSGSEDLEEEVHDARKALKKCRSILRILRPVLGSTYRTANTRLRDLGMKLSELRDTQALSETIDQFGKDQHSRAVLKLIRQIHSTLGKRKKDLTRELIKAKELAAIAEQLDEIRKQTASWSIAVVHHETVIKAVTTTVRRGGKAFKQALRSGEAEDYHECRKRAKDLRYQLELLEGWWPDVLSGYAKSAKNLEQYLGEDHNLAVLSQMLEQMKLADDEWQDLKVLLMNQQATLRRKAEAIGHVLYAEKPKHWAQRLELCEKFLLPVPA